MLAIVSVLVTFLSLVQNTRHPQIKGGEFYFGLQFYRVQSKHGWLVIKQKRHGARAR